MPAGLGHVKSALFPLGHRRAPAPVNVIKEDRKPMSDKKRKYAFSWDLLGGDYHESRPNLGPDTKVAVYRLFQFTLRDVLEQDYGSETADILFRRAGVLAGKCFFEKYCRDTTDLNALVAIIQSKFKELGIGIFRVESVDDQANQFTLNVAEDLDCSGLPDVDEEICVYDEGFIKGILDSFSGKSFEVREIDCWCTGARVCRFKAEAK